MWNGDRMSMEETEQKLFSDVERLLAYAHSGHEYIIDAIYDVFGKRILQHGYADAGYILRAGKYGLNKNVYYTKLPGSKVQKLFVKSCIPSEDMEVMLEYLDTVLGHASALDIEEEKALIFWLFLPYRFVTKTSARRSYLRTLLTGFFKNTKYVDRYNAEFVVADEIVYNAHSCHVEIINSVEEYAQYTFSLKEENSDETLFYRGHSLLDYALVPGIKRKRSWFTNESIMYQELLVRCAQNFTHCQTHLEYLVEMQHYGLPTRLLDITENPLVALYFACCSNREHIGEVIVLTTGQDHVRYAKSDTAALLAALPTLNYREQAQLYRLCMNGLPEAEDAEYQELAGKLASEVKSRNPAFEPRIRKSDITGHVFVTPIRNNQRIMKQDGSFIICGLTGEGGDSDNLDSLRCKDSEGKQLVLVINDKETILKELDTLSINRATLFPEIDDVAEYLKGKYGE